MNICLVNGEVRFLTHKVEWQEKNENRIMHFYDVEKKNVFVTMLRERGIEPNITEYEQPSQKILDKVKDKKFQTIEEARKAIEGTAKPTQEEIIQQMALVIAALDAELQALKEGSAK